MSRRIVVDATNWMHKLEQAGRSKGALASETASRIASAHPEASEIHLVFDGYPFSVDITAKNVLVHFSFNQSADEIIARLLSKKGIKPGILYSADEALKSKARRAGADTRNFPELTNGTPKTDEKPDADSSWQEKLMRLRFDT